MLYQILIKQSTVNFITSLKLKYNPLLALNANEKEAKMVLGRFEYQSCLVLVSVLYSQVVKVATAYLGHGRSISHRQRRISVLLMQKNRKAIS